MLSHAFIGVWSTILGFQPGLKAFTFLIIIVPIYIFIILTWKTKIHTNLTGPLFYQSPICHFFEFILIWNIAMKVAVLPSKSFHDCIMKTMQCHIARNNKISGNSILHSSVSSKNFLMLLCEISQIQFQMKLHCHRNPLYLCFDHVPEFFFLFH